MKTINIVKGYNGIMDLDLTNIPLASHKEMTEIHRRDIETYKIEQAGRPPHLRYENAIETAYRKIELLKNAQVVLNKKYLENQQARYVERCKSSNNTTYTQHTK